MSADTVNTVLGIGVQETATMAPLDWLTLGLVLITGYYAWQTHRTVAEMRDARLAAIRPHLVPVFKYDEPGLGVGAINIENLGQGSALDIDVTLSLEPDGMRTRWQGAILRSGERRLWSPTTEGGPGRARHPVRPAAFSERTHVRIVGRCRDIAGKVHTFDERVPLRDDWQIVLDMTREAEGDDAER